MLMMLSDLWMARVFVEVEYVLKTQLEKFDQSHGTEEDHKGVAVVTVMAVAENLLIPMIAAMNVGNMAIMPMTVQGVAEVVVVAAVGGDPVQGQGHMSAEIGVTLDPEAGVMEEIVRGAFPVLHHVKFPDQDPGVMVLINEDLDIGRRHQDSDPLNGLSSNFQKEIVFKSYDL